MRGPTRTCIAGLILLAANGSASSAQVARGHVHGVISDSIGRRIRGAQVSIVDTDIRALSGADGSYLLPGVWPGKATIQVRALPFAPETLTVTVAPGDTSHVNFTLRLLTRLPTVATDVEAITARMAAFEERRARGIGAFVTRQQIETRHPHALSEMLRGVAGLSLGPPGPSQRPTILVERSSSSIASGTCSVQLYVDGIPYTGGSVDDFPPETVEAMEIYRGGSELPAAFRTQNSGCGLIAIWTRDPINAGRTP